MVFTRWFRQNKLSSTPFGALPILKKLLSLPRVKLYLTETPFKGRKLLDYPVFARNEAILMDSQAIHLLDVLDTNISDLVVVTGSLYLIGNILAGLDSIKLRHGK